MKINEFKKSMEKRMIDEFEKNGYINPLFFMLKDGKKILIPIPPEFLSDQFSKTILADMIKSICMEKGVMAAGILIEAYFAKFKTNDEMAKFIENGTIKVSEYKNKEDIILMIFSTPFSKDEVFGYVVNTKTKTVGERVMDDYDKFSGIFSGLFIWNQN